MRLRRIVAVSTLALGALVSSVAPAVAADRPPTAGSASGGDPYFPRQGNGGYDVSHYRLDLAWKTTAVLTGTATISARATQNLSRFDLDLRTTLVVSRVEVDGQLATADQPVDQSQELVVTPAHPLTRGAEFTVRVSYSGVAQPVTDPDGSLDGFIPTDDGVFVASEPQGAPTWFPVNDMPSDKATYAVSMTVPKGLVAVSNGRLVSQRDAARTTTWSWRMDQPISSYLVTATIGKFEIHTGKTGDGVPYFTAVDPRESSRADPVLAKLPDIVDYFSSVYGNYAFGQTGAIVDDARNVGYALETATRPVFDRAPSESTLAHELAHQWFGDSVTVQHWRDIWLNEGFAEFSSWLWEEHTGGQTTSEHLHDLLALPASRDDEWLPAPGNPGDGSGIFAGSVYDRGAATLAALRDKLGDATFFQIMRGWFAGNMYANAHVGQFTDYAASVAHQDLRAFFHNWLYAPRKPHL